MLGKLCYSIVNSTIFAYFLEKKINQNFEKEKEK